MSPHLLMSLSIDMISPRNNDFAPTPPFENTMCYVIILPEHLSGLEAQEHSRLLRLGSYAQLGVTQWA